MKLNELQQTKLIFIGIFLFAAYALIARKLEKINRVSMHFDGVAKNVSYDFPGSIDVDINNSTLNLRDYQLFLRFDPPKNANPNAYRGCIISNGDSLIKKKGEWPILLIKHDSHKKIYLKCSWDNTDWF